MEDRLSKPTFENVERLVPKIEAAVRRRLSAYPNARVLLNDLDDVVQDVVYALLRRISKESAQPIEDLQHYMYQAIDSACAQQLRKKFPGYAITQSSVRYFANHIKGVRVDWKNEVPYVTFVVWAIAEGESPRARALEDSPDKYAGIIVAKARSRRVPDLIKAALDWAGSRIRLDALVATIAHLSGKDDAPSLDLAETEVAAGGRTAEEKVQYRHSLPLLWEELASLPKNEACALFLGFRDQEENEAISTLMELELCTNADIAKVLGLTLDEFESVLPNLPLPNRAIARMLNCREDQISSMRSNVRKRLRRRIGNEFLGDGGKMGGLSPS